MIKKSYLFVVFVLLTLNLAGQEDAPFDLINKEVLYFEDQSALLTIDDVVAQEADLFKDRMESLLDLNNTVSKYWIKIQLQNDKYKNPAIELAQSLLPNVSLYQKNKEGVWEEKKSGYQINLYDKIYKHQTQIFDLSGNGVYYLSFKGAPLPIPIRLWEKDTLDDNIIKKNMMQGVYVGIMFFVILLNLLLFFSLKKSNYLHYAFLVFMYAAFVASSEGYIMYLFPNLDLKYWYYLNPVVNQANGTLFCFFFLEIKKYLPKYYKYVLALFFYWVSYIFWYQFLTESQMDTVSQIHALVGMLVMSGLGIVVWRKGNILGLYFALAYLLFVITAGIEITYLTTGSPSYLFEISHISLGILIEVFILAILLAKRFQWEREKSEKEKNEAQRLVLEKTQENEKIVLDQNTILEHRVKERTLELNKSVEDLKQTQAQLIQSEKLASLGELTAGIAHEIQNPLNFVNNFAEVSQELISELEEELDNGDIEEVKAISKDVVLNLSKINHHGKRASNIVRGMLDHSRKNTGEKLPTDINELVDEYVRLSYHGLRAKDKTFNAGFKLDLDPNLPKVNVVSQDIGRVFLNLITNGFQALDEKAKSGLLDFKPLLLISTKAYHPANDNEGRQGKESSLSNRDFEKSTVEIIVSDNGPGIAPEIVDKIFQPFFTTKPTGKGTGLGLSMAYDIVKSHGGQLSVKSDHKNGTEFKVKIPL